MLKSLQLKTILLLIAVLMGGGSVWAEEVVYKTALFGSTYNSKGVSSYGDTWTATNDGFTVSLTNFNNNNNGWSFVKCGRKNNASVATITTSAAIDEAITKVSVTIDAITAAKVNSIKLYTSSDNSSWTEAGSYTAATDAQTVTLTTPTENLYYRIEFDCASGTSNGLVTVSKIEYYKNEGAADTRTATSITIDNSGITNTNVYGGNAAGTLAATVKAGETAIEGATVTWSTEDTGVATVDEQTGAIALVAAGTATITASYAGSDIYKPSTATYTLTVTNSDPNAPGTANNPYTVAQARAAIDAGTGVTGVYATGIVSKIVTAYSSQYGNISYNISADGTTTSDQLESYRGKSYNGDDFTSEDDIKVGDVVVIYGNLTKHNDTYEFAANNQLVSLVRPADTTPSIEVSTTSIEVADEETEGTIEVEYKNITEVVAEVKFCDVDGEDATYDWIDAEIDNNNNNIYYTISANEGEARTAYFKVYALDDEENFVYSKLITVNQAAYEVPEAGAAVTFDFSTNNFKLPEGSSNKTDNAAEYSDGKYTINVEGSTGEGYYWHTTGYLIIGKEGASITFPAFNFNVSKIKVYGRSGASGKVTFNIFAGDEAVSTEATSSLVDHEFVIDDNSQEAGTVYTFKVTGNANAQITKIEFFGYENVTVTSAGYATYCSENALDLTNVEGLTAYKATIANKQVNFTPVTEVPAGQGVLLKGAANTYKVPVIASAEALTGNQFIGVTEETTVEETGIFVLMKEDAGVGFYKTTQAFTVGAHTAYLPATAGARSFIGFDNTTTAIEGVADVKGHNGEVYNLQGQRVAKAQKGLYIINGKKMVIK